MTPISTLFAFSILENSCDAPSPKSLAVARKSAFLIPSGAMMGWKALASISDVGLMRKIQGLPDLVIFPDDDVSTSMGTPYSTSLGMIAKVSVELHAPIITG